MELSILHFSLRTFGATCGTTLNVLYLILIVSITSNSHTIFAISILVMTKFSFKG